MIQGLGNGIGGIRSITREPAAAQLKTVAAVRNLPEGNAMARY